MSQALSDSLLSSIHWQHFDHNGDGRETMWLCPFRGTRYISADCFHIKKKKKGGGNTAQIVY